jgi:DNA-binding beta-propeller fold protein YncE
MVVSSTDGRVWICNPDGRSARMLASVTSFDAAGLPVCQLKFPPQSVYPAKYCSIALGRDLVFFADKREHCVFAFSAATGDLVQTIGKGPSVAKGKLSHPTCVCVLGNALYVGEAENKRISVFDATTFEFLGLMDGPPGSDGFPSVHHISASPLTREILVNDSRLKQVRVFSAYCTDVE